MRLFSIKDRLRASFIQRSWFHAGFSHNGEQFPAETLGKACQMRWAILTSVWMSVRDRILQSHREGTPPWN